MTAANTTVPWIGIALLPTDRVVRVVIAEGARRGRPFTGACVCVKHDDGRYRVAHRFQGGGRDVAHDDFADLSVLDSVIVATALERSMRQAPVLHILRDEARALAALEALAAAEAEGDRS